MGKNIFYFLLLYIFVVLLINPSGLSGQTSDNREGQNTTSQPTSGPHITPMTEPRSSGPKALASGKQ